MEEIIKSITQAEERAAQIKQSATDAAAATAAKAERKAAEIAAASEAELKAYRETELKNAEIKAAELYNEALDKERAKAVKYADNVIKNAEFYVGDIVRRISGGSR